MSLPVPQAPDIETLYDVEGDVEPAINAELRERGIFDVDAPRSTEEALTPRVEFELHLGACISRNKIPVGTNDPRAALPTAWNCTVIFSAVTDRLRSDQAHGPYRAKVRLLGAQFWTSLNTRMPYHVFEKMLEAGTQPGLVNDGARSEDISRISFSGVIKIRDGAWPAGS